jgi:hypothetical protein
MQPPAGDYPRQAKENLQGMRCNELEQTSEPPNFYYNQRQIHASPTTLQTSRDTLPLQNTLSSQDVRMAEAQILQGSNLQTNYVEVAPTKQAMVVLKSGRKTGQDIGMNVIEEESEDIEAELASHNSLEEDPDFSRLNETTRDAANGVHFDRESSLAVEPNEDEYQHVTQEPRTLYRGKDTTTHNPARPYDLWNDLAQAKANISFGQLIQLAPSLRKQMREGATVRRILKGTGSVHQVLEEEGKPDDNMAYYNAIEITVEIVDKMIAHTMVDDGSNTNIMPESTMRKLGLAITEPSFSTIKIADQGICKPIGRIRDLKVSTGGEDYHLTFEVLPMRGGNAENGSYPLLLGRGFLRTSKGVADWGAQKPTFTYGPPQNRTKVDIRPTRVAKTSSEKSQKPMVEAIEMIDPTNQLGSFNTIKCIGPGLYDFTDDGTLAQWLADYPHSDDEFTVRFIEASDLSTEEERTEVGSTKDPLHLHLEDQQLYL